MLKYDWSGWIDWTPLGTLDFSKVPTTPGAYVIATDKPINRAVGTDPDGILDVGESVSLRGRFKDFCACINNRHTEGHAAGWRFAFYHLDCHFPVSNLRLRWLATRSKHDASRAEGYLLLAYIRQHCELPPLNNRENWIPFNELGWRILDDDA
jgi:hypothetical protein